MERKHNYSVRWQQPYNLNRVNIDDLESIREKLIERLLEEEEFVEANEILDRIRAL